MKNPIINKILTEWAHRVHDGMPDPKNDYHTFQLEEYLNELRLPRKVVKKVLEKVRKYVNNPMNQKLGRVGKPWGSEGEPSKDGDTKEKSEVQLVDRSNFGKKSKEHKDAPNGPTQQQILEDLNSGNLDVLTEYQDEVEQNRSQGIAGAGGPVASEGESKYCEANNTDLGKWAEENKEAVATKKQELAGKKRNAEEIRTTRALGLDPNSDEFVNYLAMRETYVDQQREAAKNDPNHVFHKKGKKGFKGIDEDYDSWMRVAFDGAITTKAHLNGSDIDTSKPHKVVQSTAELDGAVEASLEDAVKNAKTPEDKKHAARQLKNFKKFKSYHDTYAIGTDENGRLTYVGISNKKDSQMRDPQNNTTPAQRLRMIRKSFGEEVAENVAKTIDNAVENVSNAQASSVKKQTTMKIDNDVVAACEGEKMKPYMSDLDDKADDTRPGRFGDFVQKSGKDWSKMPTAEKLQAMQKFSQSKLVDKNGESRLREEEDGTYYKTDDGEWKKIKSLGQIGLPYEPFGKISIKLGEFKVNEETMGIKQAEKDVVTTAHTEVVSSLFEADAGEDGYHPAERPDADNGQNTQGYISGVLGAMHVDTYIDMEDEDDDSMLIQMGINGVKPSMIRECVGEQSGFKGDSKTSEGRKALKEHLRKRCRVTPGGEKVSIVDSEGNETELFKDQWRTAGTAQKVASHFGDGMRDCLQRKAAKK